MNILHRRYSPASAGDSARSGNSLPQKPAAPSPLILPNAVHHKFTRAHVDAGEVFLKETITRARDRQRPVHSAFGLTIVPDYDIQHAPEADVLLIPGGGLRVVLNDERLMNWIRQRAATSRYVMSVCNAAFILAHAGLLEGLSATTTGDQLARLASVAPKTRVVARRFVDSGKIITTGGLSAGIDGALHLIERQSGRLKAEEIARDIEYRWDPDGNWTRAMLADHHRSERPPKLTNGRLSARDRLEDGGMPNRGVSTLVSRADVAHFLVDGLERHAHSHQIVGMAGG